MFVEFDDMYPGRKLSIRLDRIEGFQPYVEEKIPSDTKPETVTEPPKEQCEIFVGNRESAQSYLVAHTYEEVKSVLLTNTEEKKI